MTSAPSAQSTAGRAARWLPILDWARRYDRHQFGGDLLAAIIVTLMLIPQSLAYAMLAGLPPQSGLYASMLPLLAYAVFGSSRSLSVGPAAVTSLMTAAAIGQASAALGTAPWQAALVLALMSGLILLAMGLLRLGFLANFLSHPVVSGFVSASGVLIALSQARHLLGIPANGDTLPTLLHAMWQNLPHTHLPTLALGVATLAMLWWSRQGARALLQRLGISPGTAAAMAKTAPVIIIATATAIVWHWHLAGRGIAVVGAVPGGLPSPTLPVWDLALWKLLLVPALLLSLVGFAESISVGQTLAARRRERLDPDQELIALGAGNMAAAFSGGLPVTGGFSRSVVNHDAGARTPAAGIYTAAGIAIATLLLTPILQHLPQAALAATIIVAVLSLVDLQVLRQTWRYSRPDFAVALGTLALTLLAGVETGLIAGVALSLVLHLYRSSRPHIAVIGQVPGTEHFRNVRRHAVRTCPQVLGLRVDESLYFANARFLEDRINAIVASQPALRHVVLQCSAINAIDASALESLEVIHARLQASGMTLHLSEVKGPVMDLLSRTDFLKHLSGDIHLSHYQAIATLAPQSLERS